MFKLISPEDYKLLTKGGHDAEFDPVLDLIIIPAVGKLFAQYCNRPDFDKLARTEFLSPRPGANKLFVSSPPVAATPAIQVWESSASPRVYDSAALLTEGTDYFLFENEGKIEKEGDCFVPGTKTVKVTYTGGYLTKDGVGVPDDLKLAAITQTKIFFDRREEWGVTGRSLEGGSVSMLNILTLPKQVTLLLDAYRVYGAST